MSPIFLGDAESHNQILKYWCCGLAASAPIQSVSILQHTYSFSTKLHCFAFKSTVDGYWLEMRSCFDLPLSKIKDLLFLLVLRNSIGSLILSPSTL